MVTAWSPIPQAIKLSPISPVMGHTRPRQDYYRKGGFTSGTGKYAGISGNLTNVLHDPEFRTATEETFVNYGELQASYKLP